MIEHYSSHIQNAIQRELFKAKSSIKLAVAWFTNDLLFQPILLKLLQGISVEIVLNDDNINKGKDNGIDFVSFEKSGGVVHWNNTERLMHDKFCIIDSRVVIFGSYNWTNKAEYNDETITISRDEANTTNFYTKKFELLCSKYPSSSQKVDVNVSNFSQDDTANKKQTQVLKPIKLLPYSKLNFYENALSCNAWAENKTYYFAWIVGERTRKYRLLNPKTFLPVTDFLFDDFRILHKESNNNIWLQVENKWGLYNINIKKFILEPQFEDINHDLYSNNTIVAVKKMDKWGTIDSRGRTHLPCIYSCIGVRTDQFIVLEKNKKHGLWCNGNIVFDCIYDKLNTNGTYPSKLGNKYGVVHGSEIIIPFEYDEIEYYSTCEIHYLCKNGKWGARFKTRDIIPCEYNSRKEVPNFHDYFI